MADILKQKDSELTNFKVSGFVFLNQVCVLMLTKFH